MPSVSDRVGSPEPNGVPDAVGVTAPGNWLRALELRAIPEYLVAQLSRDVIARWPHGDGHPVLVLPGFLAGARSTQFLRGALRQLGYHAHDWRLGVNLGYRPSMKEECRRAFTSCGRATDGGSASSAGVQAASMPASWRAHSPMMCGR